MSARDSCICFNETCLFIYWESELDLKVDGSVKMVQWIKCLPCIKISVWWHAFVTLAQGKV